MAAQTEAEKLAASEAKASAKLVVKYIGTSDIRSIDAESWKNVGVDDQNKVVWNRGNGWSIHVADLSKSAVAYLDKDDDGFVVQEA